MSESTRAYIYRIVTVVLPLLVVLGVLTEDIASHVVLIAAAVLGLAVPGLAAVNTSTKEN
mgnify:CR=1 FL=1